MTPETFQENTESDGYLAEPYAEDLFATVSEHDASTEFGAISVDVANAAGMLALPIRIVHGKDRGSNNGYGIRHILMEHGEALGEVDYYSVQDFVRDMVLNFDAIYEVHSDRWVLVIYQNSDIPEHRILVLQMHRSRKCYAVVTGYLRDGDRRIKGTLIWERRDRSPEPGGSSPT